MKKYLRSRIEDPSEIPKPATNGIQSDKGQSGVIGDKGDGVNAHDVCQFKTLDYR